VVVIRLDEADSSGSCLGEGNVFEDESGPGLLLEALLRDLLRGFDRPGRVEASKALVDSNADGWRASPERRLETLDALPAVETIALEVCLKDSTD
jgi:hypothetical protein